MPFFIDFSSFWPPKTKPKSSLCRYLFENIDFVEINKKNIEKTVVSIDFSGLSLQKTTQHLYKKALAKNIEKNIVFGIPDPYPMDEQKEKLNEITNGKPLWQKENFKACFRAKREENF